MTRKNLLLTTAALIAGASTFGAVTGMPSEARERRVRTSDLKKVLSQRFKTMEEQQRVSNEDQKQLSRTFELLDRDLQLARASGGIGIQEAQANWPAIATEMPKARVAASRLPRVSARLLNEARRGHFEIGELEGMVTREEDKDYLTALDEALDLFAKTHTEYQQMYTLLATGFPLYEALYERTDRFLIEERSAKFKTRREAAQVFTLATNDLVTPILEFRRAFETLERSASEMAAEARTAFVRARELKPAIR